MSHPNEGSDQDWEAVKSLVDQQYVWYLRR